MYKAQDLLYDMYQNDWDIEEKENSKWDSPSKRLRNKKPRPRYVAIKKIYVTSSPSRIFNELELLKDLRNSDSVCPLITAFRYQDQVVAILPYFQHHDFREYFRTMQIQDMRLYFKSLFTALEAVHAQGILHRDIKPTNFLYHPDHARGVLVDFGLAEREGTDHHECLCEWSAGTRRRRYDGSVTSLQLNSKQPLSYPKTDSRPSRRANRAGTRGFRAPEVLFKCTAQTTAIDVWSVGVILLTFLARRFPFFHSADDVDALLELTNIFGKKKMREAALLHGQVYETNIPSYSENGHSFEKIILWSTSRTTRDEQGNRVSPLDKDEAEAVQFLNLILEVDPHKRLTAADALKHPFTTGASMEELEQDMVDFVPT